MSKVYKPNVPVAEASEFDLRCLFSSDIPIDIDSERSTLKLLLKLEVTNVYFKSKCNWYVSLKQFSFSSLFIKWRVFTFEALPNNIPHFFLSHLT